MVCPVCGSPMEQGRIEIVTLGSAPEDTTTIINWYPETEFHKTGVGRSFRKNGRTISDACVRQTEAWCCCACKKVCVMMNLK